MPVIAPAQNSCKPQICYCISIESGLYYLNSRYYSPEFGRFISEDGLIDNSALTGTNLYAYCANNPINNSDPNGKFLNTLIGAIVGAAVGAFTAWASGGSAKDIMAKAARGAVTGAVTGAVADALIVTGSAAAPVVAIARIAAGGLGNAAGAYAENKVRQKCGESPQKPNYGKEIVVGAIAAVPFAATSEAIVPMMKNVAATAGPKALKRGITVGYAIKKTIHREMCHLGSSTGAEFLQDAGTEMLTPVLNRLTELMP